MPIHRRSRLTFANVRSKVSTSKISYGAVVTFAPKMIAISTI